MNKHDIIQHLRCCATDSIWREEAEALVNAGVAVKMLHDIFENLEGQSMKGEMIAILNQMGHPQKILLGWIFAPKLKRSSTLKIIIFN